MDLINLRGHWAADAFVVLKVGLGATEREEHVEANGDVVLVVGDVETDKLVALAVFALIERHNQATELLLASVHLEVLSASELQPRVGETTGVAYRHWYGLTFLEL